MSATTKLEHILEELDQAEGLGGLQTAIEALRDHMKVDQWCIIGWTVREINMAVEPMLTIGFKGT